MRHPVPFPVPELLSNDAGSLGQLGGHHHPELLQYSRNRPDHGAAMASPRLDEALVGNQLTKVGSIPASGDTTQRDLFCQTQKSDSGW